MEALGNQTNSAFGFVYISLETYWAVVLWFTFYSKIQRVITHLMQVDSEVVSVNINILYS